MEYNACKGLGVCHLYRISVEQLALYASFEWEEKGGHQQGKYIVGVGPRLEIFPPEIVCAHLRACAGSRWFPQRLRYLTAGSERSLGQGTFEEVRAAVEKYYFPTSHVQEFVFLMFRRKLPFTGSPRWICQYERETAMKAGSLGITKTWRLYQWRLEWLRASLCVFETLALYFRQIAKARNLRSAEFRFLERVKEDIHNAPYFTAKRVKSMAQAARAKYFGIPVKPDTFGAKIVEKSSKLDCLQMSYMARALPAPPDFLVNATALIKDLQERLTLPPPPEDPAWRPWVKRWLEAHKPDKVRIYTDPSTSAALGHSRMAGGHYQSYVDLIGIGAGLKLGTFMTALKKVPPPVVNRGDKTDLPRQRERCLALSKVLNDAMLLGARHVVDNTPMSVIRALACPEKGMKTRVPTTCLTAYTLFLQILRKLADSYLVRDKRIGPSLGRKEFQFPLCEEGYEFLSLDMTQATDGHPFWLTQTFYEELVARHKAFGKLLPAKWLTKLLGPKLLLDHQEGIQAQSLLEAPSPHVRRRGLRHYARPETLPMFINAGFGGAPLTTLNVEGEVPDFSLDALYDYLDYPLMKGIDEFLGGDQSIDFHDLRSYPALYMGWVDFLVAEWGGVTTTTGQMMGDPTSWPLLPLVTLHAAESTLGVVSKYLPTYGDDAVVKMRVGGNTRQAFLLSLKGKGGTPNQEKSFPHTSKFLFCEQPYDCDELQEVLVLSPWVGPPGGSKGTVNWYSLPTSCPPWSKGELYSFTRFNLDWRAAVSCGLPLRASPFMGGIGLPKGYSSVDIPLRAKWFQTMATMNLRRLITRGGLSLMPGPTPHVDMEFEDAAWNYLYVNHMASEEEAPWAPTALLAWGQLNNPRTVLSLFTEQPQAARRTPSVLRAAKRFRERVQNTPIPGNIPRGSYVSLQEDLRKKRTRRVISSVAEVPAIQRSVHLGLSVPTTLKMPAAQLGYSKDRLFGIQGGRSAPTLSFAPVWEFATTIPEGDEVPFAVPR